MTPEQRRSTIEALRRELATGARSPGWNFAPTTERASQDGAPRAELEFLDALAAVIADGAPLSTLERFDEWRSG